MNNSDLAKKLKNLRLAHSYKQVDVASAIGVLRQTYSHYENGDRTPNAEILYKLAAFYNISINDLMQHTVNLDPELYYETKVPSEKGNDLDEFIAYMQKPENKLRFKHLDNNERELLYYFEQVDNLDKWELIEFAKILAQKRK